MRLLLSLLVVTLVGCTATPPRDPNYPEPELGGAISCPKACTRARELKCKIGNPTPNGRSCEDVCRKFTPPAEAGWRPECMAAATDCTTVESCTY